MLQEAPDDGAHADVVGDARHLRRQHAGAAHDQVDLHAGLAGTHQRLDEGHVGERIHLGHDAPGHALARAIGNLGDLLHQPAVQVERRHPQVLQARQPVVAGQVREHGVHLAGEAGVGGEVADVGVEPSGARVVVTGGQVPVAPQVAAFAPGDQQHLGVGLEAHHAIHHLGAHRFKRLGPVDVGLFVEASFQLDHSGDFLAAPHGLAQQVHQLGIGAGAVDGLLDGQHLRVVHGLAQKLQHAAKALEGLVQQHVAFAQLLHDGHAGLHLVRPAWRPAGEEQRGVIHQVDQLGQAHQVDGALHAVERGLGQVELALQEVEQKLRAARRHLQPHGLAIVPLLQALAQGGAQVAHVFFVHRQVGVAGDAELRELGDLATWEQVAQVGTDDARQTHVVAPQRRHLAGHPDEARQHAGHLDDGHLVHPAEGVGTFEPHDEVE